MEQPEKKYLYPINSGVGKTVEFKGLKSQYFIAFFAGIFGLLLLFVILSAVGIGFVVNVAIILPSVCALLYYVFTYNKKYGEHGLMKQQALRRVPKFLCRTVVFRHILSNR
jgi:hypothetical protein